MNLKPFIFREKRRLRLLSSTKKKERQHAQLAEALLAIRNLFSDTKSSVLSITLRHISGGQMLTFILISVMGAPSFQPTGI